ncbi:penicillin-binding transpeptidase domain-containing protein [Nocardioides sp. zg-1228]|uniref:penicillin-binding transpeptidase domain-containing protein n=1 Tax=Nocardioides sp. zg-1228 TaxID=2763008 RepID=UPI0016432484|nr:penicillin-binding transpeptidase domain-containing protein [Nocardioides sp. zg-1228]MBC2932891.1 penicillin-binding protein [Nocardioides sp. zg-1228]QSF56902.1 penicillin-binding protein [Nocardioides sp. zg-1228]
MRPLRLGSVCATAVVLLAASACSVLGGDDADPPEGVAADLAAALAAHSLGEVPLTDEADRATFAELVAPLDEVPVAVRVAAVEQDEQVEGDAASGEDRVTATATATLAWRWELTDAESWEYDTTATLVREGSGWVVDWSPGALAPDLADGDTLGLRTLPPSRGDITGAEGQVLVTERPVLRYGLDKTKVSGPQVARSARRIARVLDVDAASFVERAEAMGPEAFVEAVVLREDDALDVLPAFADIRGALAVRDTLPLAPTREFAAALLGRVGPATAELVEESGGRIAAGDEVGLSGLQARYDEQLRGVPGTAVVARDADDRLRTLVEVAPTDGADLATTLDPALQQKAEDVLGDLGDQAPATALVAIRPSDGAVLASANGAGAGGADLAMTGQYAPGSTFKVVTALALLRSGMGVGDVVSCPASTVVDGRSFTNYDDYPAAALGDITLTQAIAQSCNTALIGNADRVAEGELAAAAGALGLGTDHDLGFPVYFGQVPPPETETGAAADMIGQGTVLASPFAMATVAASVQAGRAVLPVLLPDHEVDQVAPERPLTGGEAGALRGLMRSVVTAGSGRFLQDVPGRVGAKTGTAEHGEPDASGELPTHAWMIATRGDLAVAVFVETGVSGSQTAGPLLEAFLR